MVVRSVNGIIYILIYLINSVVCSGEASFGKVPVYLFDFGDTMS